MQTKTKLSPGPWIVLEPYTNRSAFPIAYQQGEVSHIIAEVTSQGGTPEQCRANADCMAAARDLLEALRLFMEQYDGTGSERRNRPEIIAARAAIAKAEGRP